MDLRKLQSQKKRHHVSRMSKNVIRPKMFKLWAQDFIFDGLVVMGMGKLQIELVVDDLSIKDQGVVSTIGYDVRLKFSLSGLTEDRFVVDSISLLPQRAIKVVSCSIMPMNSQPGG